MSTAIRTPRTSSASVAVAGSVSNSMLSSMTATAVGVMGLGREMKLERSVVR